MQQPRFLNVSCFSCFPCSTLANILRLEPKWLRMRTLETARSERFAQQPPGLKSGDLHSKRGPVVRKSRARSPLSGGMGSGLKSLLSNSQAKSALSGGIRSNQKLVVRKSRTRSPLSGGMGSGLKAALRKSQATSTISGGIRSNQKLFYEEVPSGIGTF